MSIAYDATVCTLRHQFDCSHNNADLRVLHKNGTARNFLEFPHVALTATNLPHDYALLLRAEARAFADRVPHGNTVFRRLALEDAPEEAEDLLPVDRRLVGGLPANLGVK